MNNVCNICGYKNPKDNFICEQSDCGAPLDIAIQINNEGLPDIINI